MKEDDKFVASKTKAALDAGLGVILCCGESLEEREAGETLSVVTRQLKAVADQVKDWSKIVVAYEPIWFVAHKYMQQCTNFVSGPLVPVRLRPHNKHKTFTRPFVNG